MPRAARAHRLTVEQRASIVRLYYKSGKNTYLTVSKFRTEYPAYTTLCQSTVLRFVSKFEEHGTMEDRLKQHCGRKKSVRVQANINILAKCIQRSPHASTWHIHAHTGLDRSSIQKILKKDLHMKTYHPRAVQALKAPDAAAKRVKYFLDAVMMDFTYPDYIFWTDEAHFSSQCSVTGDVYLNLLKRSVWPALRALMGDETDLIVYFQQDGASAHYSKVARRWLDHTFKER
ncbi:hypothetical protein EMCRGX_G011440 [Ephydatia muelleri]